MVGKQHQNPIGDQGEFGGGMVVARTSGWGSPAREILVLSFARVKKMVYLCTVSYPESNNNADNNGQLFED
jgi:hypothetical protein